MQQTVSGEVGVTMPVGCPPAGAQVGAAFAEGAALIAPSRGRHAGDAMTGTPPAEQSVRA